MSIRLLPLALVLAACGDPLPTTADDRHAAYDAARLDGDGDRALALLRADARTGDLRALAVLAGVLHAGYVPGLMRNGEEVSPNLPIRTWPGRAALARWRYERARDDSARAGHPLALFLVADDLLGHDISGAWDAPSPADRDSAAALFDRLVRSETPSAHLADLAQQVGRDAEYDRLLAAAARVETRACMTQLWEGSGVGRYDAASVAGTIGRAEACWQMATPDDPYRWDYGARTIRQLATQVEAGNVEAAALADSLRALGVFERHPRLAALLPDA